VILSVAVEPPRQDELLNLMRLGDEYMLGLYPPESCHLLNVDELEAPGVTVFVARDDDVVVGMAALVDRGDGSAELKRMFVPEAARGRGIAAALLRSVESSATAAGVRMLQLETGPLQHAAIALYEKNDFALIPNFGRYVGDSNSVCYEKRLGGSAG
jgi:putative acetyltransferase